MGASTTKYFDNSDLDSTENFINISPDTNLSYNFKVADFTIKLYEELRSSLNPVDARTPTDNNPEKFGRFVNNVGADVVGQGILEIQYWS